MVAPVDPSGFERDETTENRSWAGVSLTLGLPAPCVPRIRISRAKVGAHWDPLGLCLREAGRELRS
jgi:hypothetical protein